MLPTKSIENGTVNFLYWLCTHDQKGPIAENSYLFQYRAFILPFVYILSNIFINWCYVKTFIYFWREIAKIWTIETFIYIFLGHVRLGDSANVCACAEIKNRDIRNFGFHIELFHSLKHFRRSFFIFTSILSQCYEKIVAITNSIEWHYEIDTCSVSHGSCNVKCFFWWMGLLCVL